MEPGRWSTRAGGALGVTSMGLSGANFTLAEAQLATSSQKLAVRLSKSQAHVWNAGKMANQRLSIRSGKAAEEAEDSYVLALEDPEVRKQLDSYVKALQGSIEDKPDVVGMVFAIDGKVSGAEIYATSKLFRKLWPRLLRSCAVEALTGRRKKRVSTEVDESDIRRVFQEVARYEVKTEKRPEGTVVKVYDGKNAVLFDTEKDGKLLHRQLVTK